MTTSPFTLQAAGAARNGAGLGAHAPLAAPTLAAVLDLIAVALLVVDRRARVRHANAAAAALLARSDGLAVTNRLLRATQPSVDGALARLIADAGHDRVARDAGSAALSVPRPSGRTPLLLVIRALPHEPSADLVLVVVTDREQPLTLDQTLLRRLYGLTRAEARLAALLADGRTPRQAAAELGVTMNTLRTHLKQVLQKTGTCRQADLVSLLMRSTILIPEPHPIW